MSDPSPRPLLPYVPQPAASTSMVPERQRSYVFVDEQNRHRRLKVVRACEGCRKRKIKCDSANTNAWPCSACQRLKMQCIPPALSFESDDTSDVDRSGQIAFPMQFTSDRPPDTIHYAYQAPPYPQQFYNESLSPQSQTPPYQTNRYSHPINTPNSLSPNQNAPRYAPLSMNVMGEAPLQNQYGISQHYSLVPSPGPTEDSGLVKVESSDGTNLIDAFGNLKISNDAVAEYIIAQRELATVPVLQEDSIVLPKQPGSDQTVRIPIEWMPDESLAFQYFEYFFEHIHPYVPVLNSSSFYRLWASNKQSISPLILEAVFACAAFAMKHTDDGNRWLALASSHEESFKDVPRLSTIQGMLLLLKAREAVPKRGYYYRSWMTIVNLIAMAKDLELDQHFENHKEGHSCIAATPDECATKTRVWHMLFAIELIVGGPQGRTNYSVALETVDFNGVLPLPGLDEKELRISSNYIHFLRCIRNVRRSNLLYARLKKQKTNWATDNEFVQHNQDFDQWHEGLPPSLQMVYPPDGSAPWVKFHFVANLHAYHNMSIMVHHRPQLEQIPQTTDGIWKQRMDECYSAAKNICRLQEGLLQNCGLEGLLHMLRGINFHIYAILAAVNIHLVALTSPDQNLNFDAPEYFSRHMRLLERCSSSWPMPEISAQINSLREAFSADTTKPFELKPGITYGSPGRSDSMSPPPANANETGYIQQQHDNSQMHTGYNTYHMTPPSVTEGVSRSDYITARPYMSQTGPQISFDTNSQPLPTTQPIWNPSKIFESWNTAFGNPAILQTPPTQKAPSPASAYTAQQTQDTTFSTYNTHAISEMPGYMAQMQNSQARMGLVPAYQPQQPMPPPTSFVTPEVWQEAVASSFISTKRRYQGGHGPGHGHGHGPGDGMNSKSKRSR